MAFGKKSSPVEPMTNEQLAVRNRAIAEQFLARSKKAGRLEAQNRLATTAVAHAVLALSYQLLPAPPEDADEIDPADLAAD